MRKKKKSGEERGIFEFSADARTLEDETVSLDEPSSNELSKTTRKKKKKNFQKTTTRKEDDNREEHSRSFDNNMQQHHNEVLKSSNRETGIGHRSIHYKKSKIEIQILSVER